MAKKTAYLALAITFFAFVLRIARLDYQCLRGDESFSVWVSSGGLENVLNLLATTEPHPPLYYSLLHFWIRIAGDSEFAVRFPSVVFGVLVVPVTYTLSRALFVWFPLNWLNPGELPEEIGHTRIEFVGLLAALFVAINPLLLWHSQDARMYSMLSFFSVASVLYALGGLTSKREWLLYVGMTFLAMLSHYSSFYVIAAENFGVVLVLLVQRKDWLNKARRWFSAQAVLVAAYMPWVWWSSSVLFTHSSDWVQPVDANTFLARSLVAFGAGTTISPASTPVVLIIVALALLIALIGPLRVVRSGESLPILAGGYYLLAPISLLFAFSLQRPMFDERHLVVVVPAFALVVAIGAVMISKKFWHIPVSVAVVLVVGLAVVSLQNYYFNPEFDKAPDWRPLAAEIKKNGKPGDYVLTNYPDPTFGYYYRSTLPTGMLPAHVPIDKGDTEGELAKLASTYDRIWLIPVQAGNWDADGIVEKWLTAHETKVGEASFKGIKLMLFAKGNS